MKIDILGGSYAEKYKALNSERTINFYNVVTTPQEKDKSQTALYPTPGLTTVAEPLGTYTRGIFTARTHHFLRCFTVVDTTLYEILSDWQVVNRGSLVNIGFGSTTVYMTCNYNDEVGIFSYNASYVFNMNTNTLTQITTDQFPGNVSTAVYLDGYTMISSLGTVFFNPNSNLLTWTITDNYSPTYKPAPVLGLATLREEVYNFTSITIEIYINDGVSPWSRLPRSTISVGLVAKESLASFDGGILFLGRADRGDTAVYFMDSSYTCQIVSPFSLTQALNDLSQSTSYTNDQINGGILVSDAYAALQYSKDGHIFYFLTIPILKTTYVYDVLTKIWTERQSKKPANDVNGDNVYAQFRGKYTTSFNGVNLWTDIYSTKIFIEDYNNFTEDDNTIIRTRVSQTYSQDYQNISVHSLELDANTGYGLTSGQGVNPMVMLSHSKDGGYNFIDPRNLSLGSQGNHIYRARKRKLGTSRLWTIKLSISDPIDIMIQNCVARGTVSTF